MLAGEARGEAEIAGRVVSVDSSRSLFRLRDASGAVDVRSSGPIPPRGSLVRVRGRKGRDAFGGREVRLVFQPRHDPAQWTPSSVGSRGFPWRQFRLRQRSRVMRAVREFFQGQGFLEVETPALLPAPGQEPHLLPFRTEFAGQPLFLATSPEYAHKRLLAEGFERTFEIARSFRNGLEEHSTLHQPEFHLLEWYRAWASLEDLGRDVEALLRVTARACSGGFVARRGNRFVDFEESPCWLSVAEAFREFAGVDLEPYLDQDDRRFLQQADQPIQGTDVRDQADRFYFRTLVEAVEPRLGEPAPVLLCRYPARHAALAELCPDDPRVAARFELYVLGIELANAFQELRDPEEQERRLVAENQQRVAAGGPELPIHREFLEALRRGMPPSAGIALGMDRLCMLLAGEAEIGAMLAFPHPSFFP